MVSEAVAAASRPAVAFAGVVVTLGALLSLLVPNIPPDAEWPTADDVGAGDWTSQSEPVT